MQVTPGMIADYKKALQNHLFGQSLRYRDFKILTYAQYAAVLKSLWP